MCARTALANILAGMLSSFARMGYQTYSPAVPRVVRSPLDYPVRVLMHFHHCYRFVEDIPGPPDSWTKLPAFIIDEVRASSLHVLISVADIRAPIVSKLWATDATPTCGGEVVADIPIALARALYRHAEDKRIGYSP